MLYYYLICNDVVYSTLQLEMVDNSMETKHLI